MRRVSHLRSRGLAAKLHLALDRAAAFQRRSARPLCAAGCCSRPRSHISERAYNHAKYGEFSAAPAMEITVPTRQRCRRSRPPASTCCRPSCSTRRMRSRTAGTTSAQRFIDAVHRSLERYAPGLRAQHRRRAELLTPADIEQRIPHQRRPLAPRRSGFRSVLHGAAGAGRGAVSHAASTGLYLCGAGCHPGGGVMGVAGRNAARQVLQRSAPDMSTVAPHFRQPLLKTPFHERARALEPGRQLHPVGRLHHGRCVHHGGAGILRDPQRDDALRPDADGEVPHRGPGRRAPTSTVWSPAMSPSSSRTASPTASGATMPATSSMMARCFAWARASTGCARRSGSSTGCSIRPSASMSRSARSPSRSPRWRCRARPPAPC